MDPTTFITDTSLTCPSGKRKPGSEPPLILDMQSIRKAEVRLQEVATVNQHKAPELMALYNKAWMDVNDHITRVEAQRLEAEQHVAKVKAVIVLDRAPELLKRRGLVADRNPAGSEDLRNAVIASDDEYQEALERLHVITCVKELLKTKAKGFENAFTSIKKIFGEEAHHGFNRNPNLNGSSDQRSQAGQEEDKDGHTKPAAPPGQPYAVRRFGKPTY